MVTRVAAVVVSGLGSAASAAVITSWGILSPQLQLEAEYDTNVQANGLADEASWVYRITPTLAFERAQGAVRMIASLGLNWETFANAEQLDGVNPFASLQLTYPSEFYTARLGGTYSEGAEQDPLRATRVRSRSMGVDGMVSRRINDRWSAVADASWNTTRDLAGSGEQQSVRGGPRLTYAYNEFLTFYGGYRFQRVSTQASARRGSRDTDFSGAVLGVDGNLPIRLLPRVVINASAGWEFRSGEGVETKGGLVGTASIEYALSSLTVLTVSAGQDFVTSLDEDQGRSTRAGIGLRHRFLPRLSATAGAGWQRTTFDGGPSDGESQAVVSADLGLEYRLVRYARFFARASFSDSASDSTRRDFIRSVYTLGASFDY